MLTPRTWIALPIVILDTLVMGLLAICFSFVDKSGKIADFITLQWARILARGCGMKVEARGLSNVDAGKTYVIVANHQSHLDTVALYLTSPVPVRMLAKASLFKIPVFGSAMRRVGHVAVSRKKPLPDDRDMMQHGVENLIKRGESVVVFAEGTRGKGDVLQPFKKGAFHLARQYSLPILPVAIEGTAALLPPKTMQLRSGKVRVTFLAPIEPVDMETDAMRDRTYQQILDALAD